MVPYYGCNTGMYLMDKLEHNTSLVSNRKAVVHSLVLIIIIIIM